MAALILLAMGSVGGLPLGPKRVKTDTTPAPASGLRLQRGRKPFRLTGQRRPKGPPAAPKPEKALALPAPRANIDEARASLEGALRGLGFRPAHVRTVLDRLSDRVGREDRSETLKAAVAALTERG